MTDSPNSPRRQAESQRDGFGSLSALQDALSDPRLREFVSVKSEDACRPDFKATSGGRQAAYQLSEAFGQCRLFGVDLGELEGPLPVAVAIAAGQEIAAELERACDQTSTLYSDWLAAGSYERDDVCFTKLEQRMSAWAVSLAMHESSFECIERTGFVPRRLDDQIDDLLDLIDRFDAELQDQLDVLSTVAHLPLLANWRARINREQFPVLPWWLDGTLERVALELENALFGVTDDEVNRLTAAPSKVRSVSTAASPKRRYLVERLSAATGTPDQPPPQPVVRKQIAWKPKDPGTGGTAEVDLIEDDTAREHVRIFFYQHNKPAPPPIVGADVCLHGETIGTVGSQADLLVGIERFEGLLNQTEELPALNVGNLVWFPVNPETPPE